jgi:hypothetical protein
MSGVTPIRVVAARCGALLSLAVLGVGGPAAAAPGIAGDYLEARTADVYTGPCFANSEVNLVGKEAILAWHVRVGAWQGVPLAGLSVVAALRADDTLGDPFARPLAAHALMVVDERATAEQRAALVSLAHALGGPLLADVVAVESAPIELRVETRTAVAGAHPMTHPGADSDLSGAASLQAGGAITLTTRGLNETDHLCGNEEVYYPPLTAALAAVPAVTLVHDFSGAGLGKTWSSPHKRSAFVGHFAR